MRQMVRCIDCHALRYDSEVRFDPARKDYVCKDPSLCLRSRQSGQSGRTKGKRREAFR